MQDAMDPDHLGFIINHIFMPPKLPQQADDPKKLADMNGTLLGFLHTTAVKYQLQLTGSDKNQWKPIIKMLSTMCSLQGCNLLSKTRLKNAMRIMNSGDILALHIDAQNAGIIMRHVGDEIIFESFEASPTAAAVMGAQGKLVCSYPGPAIAVSLEKAKDQTFCEEFSLFIKHMNKEVLDDAMPKSRKAGTKVIEERDTAHPMFITEMLTGILRAIGRPADIDRFQKRIADDVLWNSVKLPWRRSPLWLVVRVALQIALKRTDNYKNFMIFLVAEILHLAVKNHLPSDILFVMNAKLSRRVYKMKDQIPKALMSKAYGISKVVFQKLRVRWTKIQENSLAPPIWAPEELSFPQDTHLSLHNSSQYLASVMDRKYIEPEKPEFDPSNPAPTPPRNSPTDGSTNLPNRNLSGNTHISSTWRYILLVDFEVWVQENLQNWVASNLNRKAACQELSDWIDDYTSAAKTTYKSNPENTSIMLLTTLELWVAMDRIAVKTCKYSLLSDYDPGFPEPDKLFDQLLLPRYHQMERLHQIEEYIQSRQAASASAAKVAGIQSYPSIFSDTVSSNVFAVRYFKKSSRHRKLQSKIEEEALEKKERKIQEFERKKEKYDDLLKRARGKLCTGTYNDRGIYQHYFCENCELENQAKSMRIGIYEWPLPSDQLKRMAVVFELECPLNFSLWRDTTYKILTDILTPTSPAKGSDDSEAGQPYEQLWKYSGLKAHFNSPGSQHLAWSSSTKSFLRSHYSEHRFPTSLNTVNVDNALNFRLFDRAKLKWVKNCLGNCDVREICTFSLPKGPYQGSQLQYAVNGNSHTSNQVISHRSDCSTGLTLHEYYSFGTLRAGHRLQWLNIARELRANILTFNDEAVNALIMQAAWQAGPSDGSNIYRESHMDLKRLEFGETLLGELNHMLTSIEANWLESISVKILINLTTHLLTTNRHASIIENACVLLRRARAVTLRWTHELVGKLQQCGDEANMKDLQIRVLQMAAICRGTYDVDKCHFDTVFHSAEDVATFVECGTIVHENTPAKTGGLPLQTRHLLDRDRRLSHTLEKHLLHLIVQGRAGLDNSIKQVYPGYKPGSRWEPLHHSWVVTKTAGGRPQTVHYNLLSSELLVDAVPLGRMPLNFVLHPTYQRILCEKILDVFPSNMSGMRYQTKHEISGYQVHFSMIGDELVIRAQKPGGAEIYELVPFTKLSGDFPIHLVEEYVHWLNIETGDIEFRPLKNLWESTPQNWHVLYSRNTPSLMLLQCQGYKRMLDIRSYTALMIGLILSPLESPDRIEITFDSKDGTDKGLVSIQLPRLKLDFFINERNELECRQFQGAVVYMNRNIGTMYGLANQLVLRQKTTRSVLIPYGDVKYHTHENHTTVNINTEGAARTQVPYYVYNIDVKLGRLVGNGSLASHLYKIYLHAITAHCMPDPLTRRTGTEEALDNLRSAATWSFQRLQSNEIEILRLIASLTPIRLYYPAHLESMQKVCWNNISPIAQHEEFDEMITSIFNHATQFHIFREDEVPTYYKSKSKVSLLRRAAIRNANHRKHEFSGSLPMSGTVKDTQYIARDILINGASEMRVWNVARAVDSWSPNLDVSPRLMDVLQRWKHVNGVNDEKLRLGYKSNWLNPNLAGVWGSVYDACRQSLKDHSTYQLMFFLSTLVYLGQLELELIGSLLAFATVPEFRRLAPPQYSSYDLTHQFAPDKKKLVDNVESCATSYKMSQEASLVAKGGESDYIRDRRRRATYNENLRLQSEKFVANLLSQWPCASLHTPWDLNYRLIDSSKAMAKVKPMFDGWYKNKQLQEHTVKVQRILNAISPVRSVPRGYIFKPCKMGVRQVVATVSFEDLLRRVAPTLPISHTRQEPISTSIQSQVTIPRSGNDLKLLLSGFKEAHSKGFKKQYADSMLKSLEALEKQTRPVETVLVPPPISVLKAFVSECKNQMDDLFLTIYQVLSPFGCAEHLIKMAGLWPSISPISLLQHLATNSSDSLSNSWKSALVLYGKAITRLQRAERLLKCGGGKDAQNEFQKEAENIGHQEWDPIDHPDWLLIEIEHNILVRPVQNRIASEMICPTSGKNQTLQLNMGEGKSSVIVPIIAASLADGTKLVRVVVLKPLSTQMFQLLVQKLSGLTNRRIFYMPFSRAVKLDDDSQAKHIQRLYEECKQARGILLIQPEHILSFKLVGFERLDDNNINVAKALLDSQSWLEKHSRDILDESDEILHVRNELIYTIGQQKSIEHSPDRWMIVQEIFSLIQKHTTIIQKDFPQGLEVETSQKHTRGGFPITRILKPEAGRKLLSRVASDVIKGLLPTISFRLFPEDIRRLAFEFITDINMTEGRSQSLFNYCGENDISKASLLLLRGLIAENIIFFALMEKRWRVDYGLRMDRTLLAVPFRAKDVPAPRSEFSHPDVAITLTCLSYYYTGLNDSQLEHCFRMLFQLSNPEVEYEGWIEGVDIPDTLRKLSGINLLDKGERTGNIFPLFRFNKSVVDFYLKYVVFPKEAKEFPHKLSSSGWDIGGAKTHPTTGFSGTNDSRDLLPLDVTQHESCEQLNTNAKVLSYLLQPENGYLCAKLPGPDGERLKVDGLLEMLAKESPPIQVLLDVGAQVLELQNDEVAAHWLRMPTTKAQAVVFFNDNDELTVLSRDGSIEPYAISTFAKQMDQCLVYLDEAHTRGTDLKLPTKSRAAVTLGPNLTKDRLVQACMRMRKLGHGQSVLFCAPPEIEKKILDISPSGLRPIKVSDLLHWCMAETCTSNRNNVPIWAKQGINYQSRHRVYQDSLPSLLRNLEAQNLNMLPPSLREPEAQSLEQRFGIRHSGNDALFGPIPAELKGKEREVGMIRARCLEFDVKSLRGTHVQEEQERELSYEVEREQQIERPPKETPLPHRIHPGVLNFIVSGTITKDLAGFIPAFEILLKTSAKGQHENVWFPNLLATMDFARTIRMKKHSRMDNFLRPVHWIISSTIQETPVLVIMSPYEVNKLLPKIRKSSKIAGLHIYSPKITKGMRSFFEDMESWTISPHPPLLPLLFSLIPLKQELNLFAGELYLQNHDAYRILCNFLGLFLGELPLGTTAVIHSDGFVEASSRKVLGMGSSSPFSKSPITFLRKLMAFRRQDQDYLATHLGQILYGKLLAEEDFKGEPMKTEIQPYSYLRDVRAPDKGLG